MRTEVLSPAGDPESLSAALRFGADAVYLAGRRFGMRSAAKNFAAEELYSACELAHSMGRRVYLTCNTLPRNADIPAMPDFLAEAARAGVDAFIIADLGVFEMAKRVAPDVERHISTQGGVINYESARAWYELGAKRVVMAREATLEEIAQIRAKTPKELEIECFVHGAMCVSFSGRCLISSYLTGRDANRGDCAQPCRWKYHLYEENREGQFFPVEEENGGTYLYNSRDMCMIGHIPELIEAGVSSLKIEGRAKTYYYTAVTANAYRHAVDEYEEYLKAGEGEYRLSPWIREELEKISHREYSTGFYFGTEPGQSTANGGYIRRYNAVAVCEESSKDGVCVITQRNKFCTGDELDILPPDGRSYTTVCLSLVNDQGEPQDAAPHPMQKLWMTTDKPVEQGAVIRKRIV